MAPKAKAKAKADKGKKSKSKEKGDSKAPLSEGEEVWQSTSRQRNIVPQAFNNQLAPLHR